MLSSHTRNRLSRLARYTASFFGAFIVWMALAVIEAKNPFLPWQYPVLALVTGMSFPGGASPMMHYSNHVAETWFPFLIAFLIARALTRKRAGFWRCLLLYVAFLAWSLAMVWLDRWSVPIDTILIVGLSGAFIGGAILYMRLVD